MLSENKITLIAIAKDEAPYLHEWVYHHLQMGFDSIKIGINRTTDNSLCILDKINKNYPNVNFETLDWMDQATLHKNQWIQSLAYAYLSKDLKASSVTHVMFLDIDEFWFSKNGESIHNFIDENEDFDIASFQWLNQRGEKESFSPPFLNATVEVKRLGKSLINIEMLSLCNLFRAHVPMFNSEIYSKINHIDQLGKKNNCSINNGYNDQFPLRQYDLNELKYGILHRMLRSEDEYTSLVFRGNPNGDIIKSNGRSGFYYSNQQLDFCFDEQYYSNLNLFIEENHLLSDLNKARKDKLEFYKGRIDEMTSVELIKEFKNAAKALNQTKALGTFVEAFISKVNCADSLRDFCFLIEKSNLKLAYDLIEAAKIARPSGPAICRKYDELKLKL